jgi:hypothetical protein
MERRKRSKAEKQGRRKRKINVNIGLLLVLLTSEFRFLRFLSANKMLSACREEMLCLMLYNRGMGCKCVYMHACVWWKEEAGKREEFIAYANEWLHLWPFLFRLQRA